MKITVLAENTSVCGLPAEHGLSLFVEAAGRRFLFDTGASGLFARNADALGINLDGADFAVLSHGHNDHGGGLGTFFARNAHAPVYASRYAFEPHYNASGKNIGLDPALLDTGRFILTDEPLLIAPGLTLFPASSTKPTSPVAPATCRPTPADGPASPAAPAICRPSPADGSASPAAPATCRPTPAFDPGGLKTIRDGCLIPEDFRHEQYLLVEENGKRVLFSGCSHRGVVNLMRRFRPDVLIGGFHFFRLPLDDALAVSAAALDAFAAAYYTCHCTGEAQYAFLKERMKSLRYIGTGDVVEI